MGVRGGNRDPPGQGRERLTMFCDHCGHKAREGALYCAHCGQQLTGATESPTTGDKQASTASTRSSDSGNTWLLAVLDATGVGLGHFALGRVAGGIALTVGTVAVIAVGFALPHLWWLAALCLWLLISAAIGYRAGRRALQVGHRPRHLRAFVAVAIAALIAAGLGYWQYAKAANQAWVSALGAHRAGECSRALHLYGHVQHLYKLSYKKFPRLSDHSRECKDLVAVDSLVKQQKFRSAFAGYEAFEDHHPGGLIDHDVILGRYAATYLARGDAKLSRFRKTQNPDVLVSAAADYDT
jgi:hypothetical protein